MLGETKLKIRLQIRRKPEIFKMMLCADWLRRYFDRQSAPSSYHQFENSSEKNYTECTLKLHFLQLNCTRSVYIRSTLARS